MRRCASNPRQDMKDDARYIRRKKRLQTGLKTQSPQLKAAYQRADDMTDAAVDAYLRLVEAADTHAAAYREHPDRVVQSITERSQRLIESAEAVAERLRRDDIDPRTLRDERASILNGAMTQRMRVETYKTMDDWQAQQVASVFGLGKVLWEKIIAVDDKEFSKEVALKAIEAVIGLAPGSDRSTAW
jgi:hypothetical protein